MLRSDQLARDFSTSKFSILSSQDIPVESYGPENSGFVQLKVEHTDPVQLRKLGFRLGKGVGIYRYILYFDGNFCGVVI